MIKTVNVDMEIKAKKFETALNKFFSKYPELDYWRETFEYMHETGENHFVDDLFGDGTKNQDWTYSLWLDENEGIASGSNYYYFAVIERA